jgi:hypothetical protein
MDRRTENKLTVSLQTLTAVCVKAIALWYVTPCSLVAKIQDDATGSSEY